MVVEQVVSNLKDIQVGERSIELFQIEWFEAGKRIQRRKTNGGIDVAIRFLKEGQRLQQNDVLYMDNSMVVVVDILPCDAVQVEPHSILEMGSLCYEIGNKHLPIFFQDNSVLIPYEDPIFRWLTAAGYHAERVHTKLLNTVNATVQPHGHSHENGGESIFSKIMGYVSK